ncbi:MAG: efflux RND transporter periplasmic adaptor subunit, partial [Gemmatimonadetes bacterium]|nr:efflux RND transporter periplasmic adaptor subunit [Gemmatimonadota bacterium]
VVPFEREITVTAPAAGTVLAPTTGGMPPTGAFVRRGQPVVRLMFLPGGSDLARIRESVAVTDSRYSMAKLEAERADRLFETRTITRREWELAKTALASAEAEWRAAQARQATLGGAAIGDSAGVLPMTFGSPRDGVLWHVFVSAGQTVAAGAPLFEVISLDPVWIRVPIYAGDLATIARGRSALVRELGGRVSDVSRSARPIAAPPSADATASSVDLYFELRNPESLLRPGHRVTVSLPMLDSAEGLVVPWSAVLYDINGGTWVYEQLSASMFARRRIELSHRVGEWAVLTRGPEPGARVVTAGAAELFGTEFGTGK